MQDTQVQSLGQEDPLEREMSTHSIFLAWEIPWTEEPGGLQSVGSQKSRIWPSDIAQKLFGKKNPQNQEFLLEWNQKV